MFHTLESFSNEIVRVASLQGTCYCIIHTTHYWEARKKPPSGIQTFNFSVIRWVLYPCAKTTAHKFVLVLLTNLQFFNFLLLLLDLALQTLELVPEGQPLLLQHVQDGHVLLLDRLTCRSRSELKRFHPNCSRCIIEFQTLPLNGLDVTFFLLGVVQSCNFIMTGSISFLPPVKILNKTFFQGFLVEKQIYLSNTFPKCGHHTL